MEIPAHQRVLTFINNFWLVIVLVLTLVDVLLGSLTQLLDWVTPYFAKKGTFVIVGLWILAEIYIRRFGFDWVVKDKIDRLQKVRYKHIRDIKPRLLLLIIVGCLWIPSVYDFLHPVNIPEVGISLSTNDLHFTPGQQFHGVEWKSDFYEYDLKVKNKSSTADIYDFKLDAFTPGGIVKYFEHSKEGVANLAFKQEGFESEYRLDRNGIITEERKIYPTNFNVNTSQISPEGNFTIRIILKIKPDCFDHGTVWMTYKYLGRNNKKKLVTPSAMKF